MKRHPLPCGCAYLTNNDPIYFNGVEMSHMVATVKDIEHCPEHKAEWDKAISAWADKMLDEACDKFFQES